MRKRLSAVFLSLGLLLGLSGTADTVEDFYGVLRAYVPAPGTDMTVRIEKKK